MSLLRVISAASLLALSVLTEQAWAKAGRIISLLPSATEAVCALGACDRLVGVDDFSLDPASVRGLPRLGKTWQPNMESILQLQPDLVLIGNVPPVLQKLQALGLNVQRVDAVTVEEVHAVLHKLDGWLETQHASDTIRTMQSRLLALAHEAAQLPAQRVYLEVDAAMYAASPASFMGQLLAALGAKNIAAGSATLFPKLSPEYVVQQAPDLIIQTYAQSTMTVHQRPGWKKIPAVKHKRICRLTAEERRITTHPGPRMAEAAEIFLRCMQMPFAKEHYETQ